VSGLLTLTSMERTSYILNGGLLNAATVVLDPVGSPCEFKHFGGSHRVNRLFLQSFPGQTFFQSIYTFDWGELEVRDVTLLDRALFQHNGGTVRHTGLLTMAGGTWQAKPGTQVFGQLQVARSAQNSNSSLSLPLSPCTVRFQASRGQPWETNASLFIRNWAGSLAGRGQHQVIFGRAPGGITAQQLAQIRFLDPVGQLPGQYAATELVNGEIVPAVEAEALPGVSIAKLSYGLVLTWPVGYTLQSSTNADGPFEDVLKQFQTVPNDSGQAAVYFPLADRARLYRLRK